MIHVMRELKRAARRVIRRRHRALILPRASIVFMSPQKCGRTWVRAMVSRCYHLTYGTSAQELIAYDNFHNADARIPIIFFTHIGDEPPAILRRLNPTALARQTVIALVRDPRDAAVSRYHHERNRTQHGKVTAASLPENDSLFDFVAKDRHGLSYYKGLARFLKDFAEAHVDFHLFAYEEFKSDPAGTLSRLMRVMGADLPAETIARAVEFAAFENLKRREAEGFFTTAKLRPADAGNPNSFKVREGKVGGHRDLFSEAQLQRLDAMVAEADLGAFGRRATGSAAAPLL